MEFHSDNGKFRFHGSKRTTWKRFLEVYRNHPFFKDEDHIKEVFDQINGNDTTTNKEVQEDNARQGGERLISDSEKPGKKARRKKPRSTK